MHIPLHKEPVSVGPQPLFLHVSLDHESSIEHDVDSLFGLLRLLLHATSASQFWTYQRTVSFGTPLVCKGRDRGWEQGRQLQ
jgi:hypothetical protein